MCHQASHDLKSTQFNPQHLLYSSAQISIYKLPLSEPFFQSLNVVYGFFS